MLQLVQMRGGIQYNSHLFIQLVQMRGGIQYNIFLDTTTSVVILLP